MIRTAAILARGRGSRMQAPDDGAVLSAEQRVTADSGLKGMIRVGVDRRPFLDYVISALADAGIEEVVFVVGPEHVDLRSYYEREAAPRRVTIKFALQAEALGTANAVLAAASAIGEGLFLVVNSDNYYPVEALQLLAQQTGAATIAFDREGLVSGGNIERDRVGAFAALSVGEDGFLTGIVEKPKDCLENNAADAYWVGMNCWAVDGEIVDACRNVQCSERGEYELPQAVALALRNGSMIRACKLKSAVLDLSRKSDVAQVESFLSSVVPIP